MRIDKIISQHRRDFQAIYKCEHCGWAHESYGYDDDYFHQNVVPKMQCESCDKKAGADYVPRQTKYKECEVV